MERYDKSTKGSGWHSFDQKGIHFIGLVNVTDLEGPGIPDTDQLSRLKDDPGRKKASTPIVVFAHIPLLTVYPGSGWGTADGGEALTHFRRFRFVTVLNGHTHEPMQQMEGNVTFHTAMPPALPQRAPGGDPSPEPIRAPAERFREVHCQDGRLPLAIVDSTLASQYRDARIVLPQVVQSV